MKPTVTTIQTSKGGSVWRSEDRSTIVEYLGQRVSAYLQQSVRPADFRAVLSGLTQVKESDLYTLVNHRIMMDEEIVHFVDSIVPELLRSLAKTTAVSYSEGVTRIRGRIDWSRTALRRSETGGTSIYVWRSLYRRYDVPENRVLRRVLGLLAEIASRVALGERSTGPRSSSFRARAGWLATECQGFLSHIALKDVPFVDFVPAQDLARCMGHRLSGYRAAGSILELLEEAYRTGSESQQRVLAQNYLVPLVDDKIFELLVLSKTIDCLNRQSWSLERIRPIAPDSGPVFTLRRRDTRCDVHFQQTPESLASVSAYKQMVADSGLRAATRRPDLVVVMHEGERRWFGLIEAKFTQNRGYVMDGIYKCLGYLRDFGEVLDAQHTKSLALLVAWSWPGFRPQAFSHTANVNVATARSLPMQLAAFLEAGAASLGVARPSR